MKKRIYLITTAVAASILLAGCSGSEEETENKTVMVEQAETTSIDEELSDDETELIFEEDEVAFEFEEETEEPLDPIDLSTYLVKDVDKYVTVGNLSNISVKERVREVTDEDVKEKIQDELSMCSTETDVDRPAQDGDVVYADVYQTIAGGKKEGPDSYYMHIGQAEISKEFDDAIRGMSVGDTTSFTAKFGESPWREDWAGETVKFNLKLTAVMEEAFPAYNDKYVQEYTPYSTVSEYESAVRSSLEKEYQYVSKQDVYEDLLRKVEANAVFAEIEPGLLKTCSDEILNSYLQLLDDGADMKDVTEVFGITETQLAQDAEPIAQRRLIVQSVCENCHITAEADDYYAFVKEQAELNGGSPAAEYERENTRSALVWAFYERKAAEALYERANVTQTAYTPKDKNDESSSVSETDLEVVEEYPDDSPDEYSSEEFEEEFPDISEADITE